MRIRCACLTLVGVLVIMPAQALVVCADPNNLPFSNRQGQGFENKLAQMLARDLHTQVQYLWWAQRRGFARNTLAQARCDLWPGVAHDVGSMSTSTPYYRSNYVWLTRADRHLAGLSFDDPRLGKLRIGVQMVGLEANNTPPANALAERGLTQNIRGFMLYGDYRQPNPPAEIINAVADGSIDVAIVWGPLAGYFSQRTPVRMRLESVAQEGAWPMAYDISVGVRRGDRVLTQRIDAALQAERPAIDALLKSYHVPRARMPQTADGSPALKGAGASVTARFLHESARALEQP
jgi:mxaJ protein